MRYHNPSLPHCSTHHAVAGRLPGSAMQNDLGNARTAQRADRHDVVISAGKAVAYRLPVLVYYIAAVAFLAAGQDLFTHRVFLSVGSLVIAPDGWVSFLIACIDVLLSVSMGRLYLAAEGEGVSDALFAASLGMSASIGAYLICYTILNHIVCLAVVVSVVLIAIRTARRWGEGAYLSIMRPLWFLFAALGFVTTGFWGWTTSAARCDLQYPEVEEERYLAEHIETATLFFDEGAWKGMTLGEKADALGEIVLVECNYLGVGEPPSLSVGPCPDTVVACYDDSKNLITFNPSYLVTASDGRMAIEAAAHETAHCYQAECVKRGYALPAGESGWLPDEADERAVEQWALEFEDYVPSTVDAKRYSEQECERTACRYGLVSRYDIESRVNKYLAAGNSYA